MSREHILSAIRQASADAARAHGETAKALHQRWVAPHADLVYETTGMRSAAERIALFAERLREYDADFSACASLSEVPRAVAAMLEAHDRSVLAVPAGLPPGLLPLGDRFTWLRDEPPLNNAQLDAVDGVVSCATVAVAVSGSIVLQHGPTEGRRVLTLLPDFHLCLLRSSQLVETLPEAMARLQATADRPTTFFSGPSATADIEMTRIKGVHGPRFLAVLLVHD